jgi:hypothetical protein
VEEVLVRSEAGHLGTCCADLVGEKAMPEKSEKRIYGNCRMRTS